MVSTVLCWISLLCTSSWCLVSCSILPILLAKGLNQVLCSRYKKQRSVWESILCRFVTSKWVFWIFGMIFYILLLMVLNRSVSVSQTCRFALFMRVSDQSIVHQIASLSWLVRKSHHWYSSLEVCLLKHSQSCHFNRPSQAPSVGRLGCSVPKSISDRGILMTLFTPWYHCHCCSWIDMYCDLCRSEGQQVGTSI